MANTFDKLSVLDSFIEEVNSYLPEIEANLERLAQSPADMEALEETYRLTHTIGGSASMMDFPGLAHVSHGMEDILGDVLDAISTLDTPTIGLLQRSLGRLHHLLQGIRKGVDQDAVIAEDDADYVQYRSTVDALAQSEVNTVSSNDQLEMPVVSADVMFPLEVSIPPTSAMASLDEVLTAFRAPTGASGEEVDWPEDPLPVAHFHAPSDQHEIEIGAPPESSSSNVLDILAAPAAQPPSVYETPLAPVASEQLLSTQAHVPDESQTLPAVAQQTELETHPDTLPQVYTAMQGEVRSLETHTSSLQDTLRQLRQALSAIEVQRTEFKGFLDGSKDALERMEDWAGQAMGLNLRNSPEQVRRYLPLSVMWVANTKLKKVFDLLSSVTSGVEMTDEQIQTVLRQLDISVKSCGEAFALLQANNAAHVLTHDPNWTAWEVQVAHHHERVTFERHGNPAAIRAEIEAKLREEIRHESLTLAARSELEQQIRTEVRQEFEAKQQLQESVAGRKNNETLHEIEARLRSEIEIQVRQEFLNQITTGDIDAMHISVPSLMPPAPVAPRTSNFADQARQAAGLEELDTPTPASLPPQKPSVPSPLVEPPIMQVTPPAPPQPVAQAMSTEPSVFPSAFSGDSGEEATEIFRLEAEEHLQTISMHVAALEKDPTNHDLVQGIRRPTHTLKGAAGMMGFRAIADLCHVSEDLLDSIVEGHTTVSPPVLSIILDTAEALDQLINGRETASADDEAKVQALRVRHQELLGEHITSTSSIEEDIDIDSNDDLLLNSSVIAGAIAGSAQSSETKAATHGDLSVRVRLQKIDELVNLFGELLVNRSVLGERIERLVRLVSDVGVSSVRLRDIGQRLESRFEAATLPSGRSVQVMPGLAPLSHEQEGNRSKGYTPVKNGSNHQTESTHLAEFDELELDRYTEFHQLARGLSETVSDMATLSTEMDAVIRECEGVFGRESRLSTTFQDRLMKARLIPLSTMTPRLYRAARSVALKQHKEFEFLLEGEGTEVDRTVYEEIAGPLLHLMRNAANHAIETPEVRLQKGKPPVGHITLSAVYQGNQVVITVRDDGTGIEPDHVRNAAIARGFIHPDQKLSDKDVIDLIFRPGFSTTEVLSEESGRGVGLDVVHDSVSRLRGTLEVESVPGQGSAFTMKFPTSLAIQSAMMVRVSGQQFAIPMVTVEAIGRLDNYKRTTLGKQPAIVVQHEIYPLGMLAQLLSLPVGAMAEKSPVLLVNTGGYRVALVVDEITGKLDVVMKSLGAHLRHVHGVAGGTVLGNGQVVLILELTELLASHSKFMNTTPALREGFVVAPSRPAGLTSVGQPSASVAKPLEPPTSKEEHGKHVLIVDDSPSVRRVISTMLKQHGWEVQMARDGVEALEMISQQTPAAVLLDIEMPRMDGYELIATLRAQEQYRTLPLVVLTSRAAGKHQQRATQLGASSYLVKPYQDEDLLNMLNSLVYNAATH